MPQITLGGRSFDLPTPTIPHLIELAGIIDNEKPSFAGVIERNGAIVSSALRRAGHEFDIESLAVLFDELSEAAGVVMRAAGFAWGEAKPPAVTPAANEASRGDSSTLSPPSAPDAAGDGAPMAETSAS